MVLINEKKYACATCIKGHRVSSCTHTDRPLFEVKKKGRPATQCQFCREKRKGGGGTGSVHSKCACGDLKNQAPVSILLNADGSVRPNPADTAVAAPSTTETRKGQPGSTPTFPNGLRDVHEMAAAAQALSGLGDTSNQAAERKLQNLLNPCNCATTGKCKCCGPKRAREYPPPRSRSPVRDGTTHAQVTDSLIEMFKSKATTTSITSPSEGNSGSSTPQQASHLRTVNLAMTSTNNNLASPDNRHRPSHTSPHVHKTRLYSPYSTNGSSTPRHGGKTRSESVSSTGSHGPGWMSPGTSPRPPLPRIRPLTDMNRFLGAAFKEDGSMATEISRSALGLPGIHAFDNLVGGTGESTKMEMDMDVDAPLAFPTAEPVVIGACTCGDGCECPGCATHGNINASPSAQQHPHECGDACKSCFDCSEHVSIPSGVTSIEQLIQVAASQVPQHPPRPHTASQLNPLDTNVLPPAANVSQDAARAFGLVQLLPLQCCNGRCQCPPGQCSCESECCGCCVRCLCDHDGDTVMAEQEKPSGCCSTVVIPPAPVVTTEDEDSPGGCCGDSSPAARTPPVLQTQMLSVASATNGSPQHLSPNSISPTSPTSGRMASPGSGAATASSSCCKTTAPASPAPGTSGTPCGTGSCSSTPNTQPPGGVIRRNSSVSRAKEAANGGAGTARRVSVSGGSVPSRPVPVSSSKTASKALALHPNQARAILPKSSGARLAPRAASSSNRQPSPVHRGSISGSSQPSQNGSPVSGAVPLPGTGDTLSVPDGSAAGVSVSSSSNLSHARQRSRDITVQGESGTDPHGMAVGVNDIANALAASDVDFMAYLNSLLTTGDGAGSAPVAEQNTSANPSSSAPDALAGSGYSFTTSLAVSSATNDLSLLGIQPGAASAQTPRVPDVESSMGDIQQLIASTLEQQGVMPRLDPSSGDYAYWLNMAQAGGGQQQQVYGFGDGSLGVPPNPLLSTSPAPPAPQSQAPFLKPDQNLYFGNYAAGFPSMPQSQLPHTPMRSVSSSSVSDPLPPHISQPMPPASTLQAPQAMPTAPSQSQGRTNPDLIDLSKPLNPSDVDRILQALLTQQSRTGGGGGVPAVPQPSPPVERSDVFKDYMLDASMVDMRGQHAPGQGQPSSSAQQQQQQQHEWLLKSGWAPTLMNQTPPS